MALRLPYLRVTDASGNDLVQAVGEDFIGVQITDLAIGETDECVIRLRRTKPYRAAPPKDAVFTVHLGWNKGGAVMTGTYRFQRVLYSGDPESGEEIGLVCRAADFTDALKRVDSEHFDAETGHKTYGDVLRTLAARAGLGAMIDPEIAKIELAGGYLLRWKQSVIGLATDIGDELGAIIKPQAGQLTVRREASFLSPSGARLPTIVIPRDPDYAFQADIEPRYGFNEVAAGWFDDRKGRAADAVKKLSGGFARLALPHLAGSEAFAKATAAAAARRLEADTATASFESAGIADAVAGAPVKPQGFGPDIDAVTWEASAITHEVGPERGWVTTVEARLAE